MAAQKQVNMASEKTTNQNLKYVQAFYEANGQTYGEPADYTWHQFILTKELQDKEDALGIDSVELSDTLHKLALTYFAQGEFKQAEDHWQRAHTLQANLPKDDPSLLETKRCLAILIYYPLNKKDKAEELLNEIADRNKIFLAETLNDLSAIFVQQKAFAKAVKVYERAVTVWQEELGAEHQAIPDMLDNLASLYYHQGNYDKAQGLSHKALDLAQKVLGAEHPGTTKISNNYAIMNKAGNTDFAGGTT